MPSRRGSRGLEAGNMGCIPGKRFGYLLRGLLCRRVLGDVAMHDASALVNQHDEHEEHPECDSWDDEKVA
jgi:hypothetical protein